MKKITRFFLVRFLGMLLSAQAVFSTPDVDLSLLDVTVLPTHHKAVLAAAEQDDPATLERLLGKGASALVRDEAKQTPLHKAAQKGFVSCATLLLEHLAEVDIFDAEGQTPLYLAVASGQQVLVYELLEHGAQPRQQTKKGDSAFSLAEKMREQDENAADIYELICEYLEENEESAHKLSKKDSMATLAHKASMEAMGSQASMALYPPFQEVKSPIHLPSSSIEVKQRAQQLIQTANRGDFHGMVDAINQGALPTLHSVDAIGQTALHKAVMSGSRDAVLLLLQVCPYAFTDIVDHAGRSALHWAADYGYTNIVQILLDYKSALEIVDHENNTALLLAAKKGHLVVVDKLLIYGAQVDARDNMGRSALHHAVENKEREMVELLLDRGGANVNATDKNDLTALHVAAQVDAPVQILMTLFDYNASIEAQTKYEHYTPLHMALIWAEQEKLDKPSTHEGVVHHLLVHGANVNALDKRGRSPLHLVAKSGNLSLCRTLVAKGANCLVKKKKSKKTAVDYARKFHHANLVGILTPGSIQHTFLTHSLSGRQREILLYQM